MTVLLYTLSNNINIYAVCTISYLTVFRIIHPYSVMCSFLRSSIKGNLNKKKIDKKKMFTAFLSNVV